MNKKNEKANKRKIQNAIPLQSTNHRPDNNQSRHNIRKYPLLTDADIKEGIHTCEATHCRKTIPITKFKEGKCPLCDRYQKKLFKTIDANSGGIKDAKLKDLEAVIKMKKK